MELVTILLIKTEVSVFSLFSSLFPVALLNILDSFCLAEQMDSSPY